MTVYESHPLFGPGVLIPRARPTDPETSHDAAKSVRNVSATHGRILAALRAGPATDEQIAKLVVADGGPLVSPSGLRTRRAELVALGKVGATKQRSKTASGRGSILWALL